MQSSDLSIKEKILSTFTGKKGKEFQSGEIKDMVIARYPETNRSSIMPADYCYNRTNIGNNLNCPFPLFKSQDDGSYQYLGKNFRYTGPVFWKGLLIAQWKKGVFNSLKKSR